MRLLKLSIERHAYGGKEGGTFSGEATAYLALLVGGPPPYPPCCGAWSGP